MSELNKRLIVAAIGIPFALVVIYFGGIYFNLAVIAFAMLGVGEFLNIAKTKSGRMQHLAPYLFTLVFLSAFSFFNKPAELAAILITLVMLLVLFVYSMQLVKGTSDSIYSISVIFNCVFYLGFGFSSLIILRKFNYFLLYWKEFFNPDSFIYNIRFSDSTTWGYIVLFIFFTIWICDSAAYFIGRKYGNHKISPEVSPKKSWEGAAAGLIAAILSISLFNYFIIPEIPIKVSIIFGLIVGIFGQAGDFAESLLKRDSDIKDSSNLLPGHGGVLDRFDSPLFVFPSVIIYLFCISIFG